MAANPCNLFLFMHISVVLSIILISCGSTVTAQPSAAAADPRSTYIIHVHLPQVPFHDVLSLSSIADRMSLYESFLPAAVLPESSEVTATVRESRLLFPYFNVFTGFAARLTEEELQAVKSKPGFVHAYPDRVLTLQTTHTPSFLGLSRDAAAGLWSDSNYGEGVIVGVLDTGVMPDHPSFDDTGVPPPPAKWKGVCEFKKSRCNNKLIGARDFTGETKSGSTEPYDYEGHGTHTAGTAAGNFVADASVGGLANGTAAGMAPYAHVAIYKVCKLNGCPTSAILAGMDAAIGDGVDVMSLSLGGRSLPFYADGVAIGAMGAIQKGILVSCAAGNEGPDYRTLSNEAPWILTVGASTMDRLVQTTVRLGNNAEFSGESAYQPSSYVSTSTPLIYPGTAGGPNAKFCTNRSLDGIDVRGKIVACVIGGNVTRQAKGEIVRDAGAVGMVLLNTQRRGSTTAASIDVIPTSNVKYNDSLSIVKYATSSIGPTASIAFKGTLLGAFPAPALASFSSRGPNQADRNILKPDIIGPGVNVLAAWPFTATSSNKFNIISGTSMATPHLSGIMALLKAVHPDWSPAAIKSSIMTTASSVANDGNSIFDQSSDRLANFFGIGAGHVVPSRAANPGLVYDIKPDDYLMYMCGLGYTDEQVSVVAGRPVKCSDVGSMSPGDLNYPSFVVFLSGGNNYRAQVSRTVTNVGTATSSYAVQVASSDRGMTVDVVPKKISFTSVGEVMEYNVTFSSDSLSVVGDKIIEASLTWVSDDDATVTVRSPVAIWVTF